MHIWDWGGQGVLCGARTRGGKCLSKYLSEYPDGTCEECLDKAALHDLAGTDLLGEEDLQAAYNGGGITIKAGTGGGGSGGAGGNGGSFTFPGGSGKLP